MERIQLGGRRVVGFGVGDDSVFRGVKSTTHTPKAEPLIVLPSDVNAYQSEIMVLADSINAGVFGCPSLATSLPDWIAIYTEIKNWVAEGYILGWREWRQGQAYEVQLDNWRDRVFACVMTPPAPAVSPPPQQAVVPPPPAVVTTSSSQPQPKQPAPAPSTPPPVDDKKPPPDEGISTSTLVAGGITAVALIAIIAASAR